MQVGPSSVALNTAYVAPDGTACAGTVEITQLVDHGSRADAQSKITLTLDSAGAASTTILTLDPPLTNSSRMTHQVVEKITGLADKTYQVRITGGNAPTVNLKDLRPADVVDETKIVVKGTYGGFTRNSTLTTKGDIFVATAAGVLTRLPVGTNGQFLTADSTTATGLKWATHA